MHRHKDAEQTAYYRRQASACATAALATANAEVKEAYLNLEQGWLCLAPKADTSSNDLIDQGTAREAGLRPSQVFNRECPSPRESPRCPPRRIYQHFDQR
jgi:hypothetical protein